MNFQIFCPLCNWIATPQTIPIYCPRCNKQSLLKLRNYLSLPTCNSHNLNNYLPWNGGEKAYQPTVSIFQMRELEQWIGVAPIWILFSGFWPEKKSHLTSASFKELDAISLFQWRRIIYKNIVRLLLS